MSVPFGRASDRPVVGDWDGDGGEGIGVVRDGTWSVRDDLGGSVRSFRYGRACDLPLTSAAALGFRRGAGPLRADQAGRELLVLPTTSRVVALTFDAGANAGQGRHAGAAAVVLSGSPWRKGLAMITTTRRIAAALGLVGVAALGVQPAAQAAAPLCWGRTPTIVGTAGPDVLRTVDGQVDVVYAGGGDDHILSRGEDGPRTDVGDFLCGGPGADVITGGAGPDRINGGDGNDDVDGWRGADVVQGNAGDDVVADASIESNDSADDVLRGGTGNDTLYGGWGRDSLYGEAGNDTLYDAECDGPTALYGGPGADYLESYRSSFEGWTGSHCEDFQPGMADKAVGGDGADTAKLSRADLVSSVESVTRVR